MKKQTKKVTDEVLKRQSSTLITIVACISALLLITYFSFSMTKSTYSASTAPVSGCYKCEAAGHPSVYVYKARGASLIVQDMECESEPAKNYIYINGTCTKNAPQDGCYTCENSSGNKVGRYYEEGAYLGDSCDASTANKEYTYQNGACISKSSSSSQSPKPSSSSSQSSKPSSSSSNNQTPTPTPSNPSTNDYPAVTNVQRCYTLYGKILTVTCPQGQNVTCTTTDSEYKTASRKYLADASNSACAGGNSNSGSSNGLEAINKGPRCWTTKKKVIIVTCGEGETTCKSGDGEIMNRSELTSYRDQICANGPDSSNSSKSSSSRRNNSSYTSDDENNDSPYVPTYDENGNPVYSQPENENNNVNDTPQTGTAAIIIAWIVGIMAIAYTWYYFNKLGTSNN